MSSDELRDAIAGALYVRDRFDSPTVVLADAILALPEMQAMLAEIKRLRAERDDERRLADQLADALRWQADPFQAETLGMTHRALDAYEEARRER